MRRVLCALGIHRLVDVDAPVAAILSGQRRLVDVRCCRDCLSTKMSEPRVRIEP